MNQTRKAPCFRGHVRKTVSPFGTVLWVSELRTPAVGFTNLGQTPTVGEAIALAIQKAYTPAAVEVLAQVGEPMRQAA
jgi:hypothetical protein